MIEKSKCTGCTACYNICPKGAIKMEEDDKGFKYPSIDVKLCVNCGLCHKICDEINASKTIGPKNTIYALKSKDESVLNNSSSGGAFSVIAEAIVRNGGVCYGAAFDKTYKVVHVRCDSIDEIEKLRTSKYVQSDLGAVFKDILADLCNNRKVLFSGTACQVSGLISFLSFKKTNLDNLLTCDLICHGVPSPKAWSDYLDYRTKGKREIIKAVNFRDKSHGWRDFRLKISYGGKTRYYRQNEDYFYLLFFHDYIIRPCCSTCNYATVNRVSDFTLGDFWGLEEFYPAHDDDKGTSVLLVRSEKGEELFQSVQDATFCFEISESELKRRQPNLSRGSPANPHTNDFWNYYLKNGFRAAIKKYADRSFFGFVKRRIIYRSLFNLGVFRALTKLKKRKG